MTTAKNAGATCSDCGWAWADGRDVTCQKCGGRNKTVALTGVAAGAVAGFANADSRSSFTALFLQASALFARRAASIELNYPDSPTEELKTEHLGCVTASVMQSCAAIEAEGAEICLHGPGHHLGSNGVDVVGRDFLGPLAELIDKRPALDRFEVILHLLRKPAMDKGARPWQRAALLVRLRNELVHYKSKWSTELDTEKLIDSLRQLRLPRPPFVPAASPFFPCQCLSAACAAWAVKAAFGFLSDAYDRLGITSPLAPYTATFADL